MTHRSSYLCGFSHLWPPPPSDLCSLCSPSLDEVVLQDVQAADHLGEDQHLVSSSQQLGQQLVDQHQFPGCLDHGLQLEVRCLWTVALLEALQDLLLSA